MMVLDRKSEVTRFQILVQVAAGQPQVKQRQIAESLDITPQAVSEYIKSLAADGMIRSGGRGKYKVTTLGVESIITGAKELKEYSDYVLNNVVGQVGSWAAIARTPVAKGDRVFISMENGIMYADIGGSGATGIAINDARKGEDVGVSDLTGLIPLQQAMVTIVKIPSIADGGSHAVDATALCEAITGIIGAVGEEALAALRRAGIEPNAFFGAQEAIAEAAIKGVSGTLVVSEGLAPGAIQRLDAAGIEYSIVDLVPSR